MTHMSHKLYVLIVRMDTSLPKCGYIICLFFGRNKVEVTDFLDDNTFYYINRFQLTKQVRKIIVIFAYIISLTFSFGILAVYLFLFPSSFGNLTVDLSLFMFSFGILAVDLSLITGLRGLRF